MRRTRRATREPRGVQCGVLVAHPQEEGGLVLGAAMQCCCACPVLTRAAGALTIT